MGPEVHQEKSDKPSLQQHSAGTNRKQQLYPDLAACSCLVEVRSCPWAAPGSCSFGSAPACLGKRGQRDCNRP